MNIRPFLPRHPGGKKGAGILRTKPNIKWEKDRGKEPVRDKKEFPWFWGWDEEKQDFAGVGKEPDGNRWNDCHYTNEFKKTGERGEQDAMNYSRRTVSRHPQNSRPGLCRRRPSRALRGPLA